MSVSGYMYNVNATKKLGELELQEGLEGNRSWHHQFKHSAYVYIGGLHLGLTEGDVVIMFSQFGEINDVNMIRDKSTGKSKGFCFVCFEDQRSTILAVDNMNGFKLLGRTLRVDHVDKYKAPKQFDESELDEDGDPKLLEYSATGAEGKGVHVYNVVPSQAKIAEVAALKTGKAAAAKPAAPQEDEDEVWARQFEASLKDAADTIGGSSKKDKKDKKMKKEKEEIERMKEEAKRLKKETKKLKKQSKKSKKRKDKSGERGDIVAGKSVRGGSKGDGAKKRRSTKGDCSSNSDSSACSSNSSAS